MHWIDPIFLPAVVGEVERFIINPHGELDGLVLAGGHLVHFPPHLSEAVAAAIRPGDTIRVHGVRLRGADMIAAVSLTSATGEIILDEGPDARDKTPKAKHDEPARQKLDARGTVRLPLFSPKGELRGSLLDEGTVLRVNPRRRCVLPTCSDQALSSRHAARVSTRSTGASLRCPRSLLPAASSSR